MKENNLKVLSDKIIKIFIFFLSISIVMSAMLFLYVMHKNIEENELFFKTSVNNANQVLQYDIYNQITALVNNAEFLSFIFSGDLTRQRHYGDMLFLFSNLDHTLIKGINLIKFNPVSKIGTSILKSGNISKHFVNLDICYLNNKANSNFGDCNYKHINLIVYFDSVAYIKHLNLIDPVINIQQATKTTYSFYPFSRKLAKFNTKSYSSVPMVLNFNIDNKSNQHLILFAIPFFSIMLIVYCFSYKLLRKEVETKLIIPLKEISYNLHNGLDIPTYNFNIIELNELISVVNRYNTNQINDRLNKIAVRVAHDIKSPLAVIELSIADILDKNNPKYTVIKNAIKSSRAIVNNMLQNYSGRILSESIFDEKKSYILVKEIIEEILSSKLTEWSRNSKKFNLGCSFNNLNNHWAFLSVIEFKRHISNLLQNSFEAIREEFIDIKINVSSINEMIMITITDNGVGMSAEMIKQVNFGQSSKKGGYGVGLESAILYFKLEQGCVDINSTIGTGTTINIFLNTSSKPIWFAEIIYVNKNLVIIDDEKSMLDFWLTKFNGVGLNIKTFNSPIAFQKWYVNLSNDLEYTFIIDYDYNLDIYGTDIIRNIKNTKDCFLVTNSYSDCEVQSKAIDLNIKLVPKYILPEIIILIKR